MGSLFTLATHLVADGIERRLDAVRAKAHAHLRKPNAGPPRDVDYEAAEKPGLMAQDSLAVLATGQGGTMRGDRPGQRATFSYVSLEEWIPQDHPIRSIRRLTEAVLADLSPHFDALYSSLGRPSIPPEEILRALLLQVLFSVRGERQLMEQINYNLMLRWFVGLQMDDRVWVPTVFSKNRDRLLAGEIAQEFLRAVVEQARKRRLL